MSRSETQRALAVCFGFTAVAVYGPVSTSCALSLRLTLPHVSPVRAPENRKMNRSKYNHSSSPKSGCRVVQISQESKGTTITTEQELNESSVSTVKNSTFGLRGRARVNR